jgi:prolyl oligopeptidase
MAMAQPPKTAQTPSVEDFHGTRIQESYRWLEDPDSEPTRQWVAQENRYTQEFLSKLNGRGALKSRLTELFQHDRYPGFTTESGARAGYFTRAGRAFFLKQSGLQNQPVLYVREAGGDRALLDPNTLSKDGTAAINTLSVSRDGKWLAYAVAKAGSDWTIWRIRDVATGQDLPDLIDWSKFSSAQWDVRGEGFYYGRYPAPAPGAALQAPNENYQLCYHKRGTPQSADRVVYQRPDQPRWSFGSTVSEDGRYLVLDLRSGTSVNRQMYYLDLSKPDAEPVQLIGEFYAAHDFLGNRGSRFYVLTNYEAPRYRIVEIDLARPERVNWRTVIAESSDTINQAQLVGETFVVNYLHDVAGRVRLAPRTGGPGRDLPLPPNSTITLGDHSASIFAVSGFTAPETIYECGTAACRPRFSTKLPFDPALFETRQVFVISKDGTKVPMFLSHRKGLKLDGSNPTLLYAYGGFNISVTPGFSTFSAAWMERGGVYAVANLRGGGEYGEQWHQAGMKQNKQNVFDDFISAAEWLIAQNYTSSPKLAIRGGSNGGLLVGAVLNQRPELFGAAIPAVGVMDMLRFDRFTIGHAWTSDYGDPRNAEDFRVLVKYSPLHNIRQGARYPATMVTTADHDDRVVPAHSFKYAAALQAAQGGSAPILIRIESSAGHGAGKPTSKRVEEDSDVLAFLLNALGE